MTKNLKFAGLLTVLFFGLAVGPAATAAHASSRDTKKFGFYGSLLSNPFPSLWGANLIFHLNRYVSFHGGYGSSPTFNFGSISFSGYNIGAGARLHPLDWDFSPFVGGTFSILNITGNFTLGGTAYSAGTSTTIFGLQAGLEWQTKFGLLIGLMYNIPLGVWQSLAAPGGYLGWVF
jgi:hypothetical protein